MEEKAVVEKLRQISLFAGIKDDEPRLGKIARIATWRRCNAGDRIIVEGEEGDELFILFKGVVQVVKRTLEDEQYTIVTLKDDEDAFFGELALLDQEVRSASVVATTDCELLCIRREDFLRLGEEDPWLGLLVTRAIGRELAKRLRKANQDMIILFEALVGQVAESGGLEEPAG